MKVFVLTIHNPKFSMGPTVRLRSLTENAPKNIEFTYPKFKEKTSKIITFKTLLKITWHIIRNCKKIDLIHLVIPPSAPGFIAVFAKKILKIPYIVDVGDPPAENKALIKGLSPNSLKFKTAKFIDKLIYKNASHIILTSHDLKKYIPTNKESTTILTAQKTENINTKIPEKKCVFLGHYGPLQNINYIIEIFEEAIKKDPEITLDIIGVGTATQTANPNIKFLSPVPYSEIPSIIQRYDMGIVSLDLHQSLDYAIPTKLLTYLSYGMPVFGTGGKATENMIHSSETGYISTKYNKEQDTHILLTLLENKETLSQLSEKAKVFTEQNLNPQKNGEAYGRICLQSK